MGEEQMKEFFAGLVLSEILRGVYTERRRSAQNDNK